MILLPVLPALPIGVDDGRAFASSPGVKWVAGMTDARMICDALGGRWHGFTVAADGDRLAITGSTLTEPQRAFLAKHKAAILQALDAEDAFEERAAIIHDAHTIAVDDNGKPLIVPICTISRSKAEARARAEVAQHPIVAAALSEFPGATIAAIRDHHHHQPRQIGATQETEND